ncbi:hypothetical protein [Intrasporangium calvum]|uniref:hypothetical protein n=1 Tax=Intrasporangium calvum TaxID=53358 RepID=UPI000DF5EC4D|nr:hypothetical protein [Intrasporangium calvum]AXG13232.1 hypothetical protein DN585_07275 [Intrasporangium calvum]
MVLSGGRRSRRWATPIRAVLLALFVASLGGSCQVQANPQSGPGTDPALLGPPLAWTEVVLPDRARPVTLATAQDGIVIGGVAPVRPEPRLFRTAGGPLTEVPVEPHSPYAFVARWLSIAVHDGQVLALGGARGGAHANVRWTVWRGQLGSAPRLVEQPQPFGVFGGWGAGDLTGVAFAGNEPVIAGAWASDRAGNDVSLWRVAGDRWARQDSTGTPLGSSPDVLNGARFVTSTGDGLALAGSVTDLGGGAIVSVPALWTAPGADGPWTLVRLPASQRIAEAHAARCDDAGCLVVGADGDSLAAWEVRGPTVTRLDVPRLVLAEHASVPAPVVIGDRTYVALPGVLLDGTDGGWHRRPGPEGVPVAAAATSDGLYLVTTEPQDGSHLWTGRP